MVLQDEYEPGTLGFDPLGLKPSDPEELFELETKELNNGRLAMIGVAGFVLQELAVKRGSEHTPLLLRTACGSACGSLRRSAPPGAGHPSLACKLLTSSALLSFSPPPCSL